MGSITISYENEDNIITVTIASIEHINILADKVHQ